jgi:hypothetical protein
VLNGCDIHPKTHGGLEHPGLVKEIVSITAFMLGLSRNRLEESKIVLGIKQPTITPRCDVGIGMTPHGAVYTTFRKNQVRAGIGGDRCKCLR